MHLIDGILRRYIHALVFAVYTVFRIKEIGHLHALLQIVLGELQHDVWFLRHGWHNQVFHAHIVVFLVGVLWVIYQFCQLYAILAEQYA